MSDFAVGEVQSDQGNPAALANGWPVEVTDGTNVLGTSAHPVRIDPTGTTVQPVSGTVTAAAPASSTSTVSRVATSTTAATLLAANASRKGFIVSSEAGITYILLGSGTVTTTNYTRQLPATSSLENDLWTGAVSAIRASGTGNVQVTEMT